MQMFLNRFAKESMVAPVCTLLLFWLLGKNYLVVRSAFLSSLSILKLTLADNLLVL